MYYQNLFINEASGGEKTSRKCDFFKLLIIRESSDSQFLHV